MPGSKATGSRFREFMPHDAPCWCKECRAAAERARLREARGVPFDAPAQPVPVGKYRQHMRHPWPCWCADCKHDAIRAGKRLRWRAKAGIPEDAPSRVQRQGGQYREFMPHAAPCWCEECETVDSRIRRRVDAGLPPDWSPSPRPCEGCGWSWIPTTPHWHKAKFCSTRCRKASRGHGTFPDSSRIHFIHCKNCGVLLRVQKKHAHRSKCQPCLLRGRADCNRQRKAIRRGARVGEPYTLTEIGDRDGWRCHLCHKTVNPMLSGLDPDGPTIDHLVPISRGGTDERRNVRLAHRRCNQRKGIKAMGEQLLLIG